LEIKDKRGRTVAKGIVNEDSLITLPEAIRRYVVITKPVQNVVFPGKYTGTLSLHFGKAGKTLTASTSFITLGNDYVIKWGIIAFVILLLIFIGSIILRRKLK
jgi:hypothetical protein